jgi:hypothetical protein
MMSEDQSMEQATKPAVRVNYAGMAISPKAIQKLDGIEEFQRELDAEYLAQIHGRPAGLGGLYHLAVEFLTTFTFNDLATLVGTGIAYDLLKDGAKRFVLRPFLDAYAKLKARNLEHQIGIDRFTINFADTILIIDNRHLGDISEKLGPLFESLASNYPNFILPTGEAPFKIYIPVIEDKGLHDSIPCFRELLEVDEMAAGASGSGGDYLTYWGLDYDFARRYRVYDVRRCTLLDVELLTREQYWKKMDEKWQPERGGLGDDA